jgi:hypothetical protein
MTPTKEQSEWFLKGLDAAKDACASARDVMEMVYTDGGSELKSALDAVGQVEQLIEDQIVMSAAKEK